MNMSLETNPLPSQWLELRAEGIVLKSGKVEIGQGLGTALLQIAADALEVPLDRLTLVAGDTATTPDEMWTSASISIEVGGAAVRMICLAVRNRAQIAAARILNAAPDAVTLTDGVFGAETSDRRLSYADLRGDLDLGRPLNAAEVASVKPRPNTVVGTPVPRHDLLQKLTGAAFIHDMDRPGMLHGRVLLPARPGARLAPLDLTGIEALPGVRLVHRDGDFVGLCAVREEQAIAALTKLEAMAVWAGGTAPDASDVPALLAKYDATATAVVLPDPLPDPMPEGDDISHTFTRPFIAHASIGLCCAIAEPDGDGLHVWSHSQGVFPLRRALAAALDLPEDAVRVTHADGAGCYGHNGADDVALDAALLARAAGAPVRVVWTRQQELTAAPAGPAMSARLTASLDESGRIDRWTHTVKSFTHLTRPGWGDGVNLCSAWRMAQPKQQAPTADPGQVPFGGAGCRNAPPIYNVPAVIDYALIPDRPLRTSAVRALGAHLNVFAIEAMMDDLAETVAADPIDFRLNHLPDPRARRVLDRVREISDWPPAPSDGEAGRGLGFARYKNSGAYCAIVADIALDAEIKVSRVWCVVDAGLAINPDGLRNQLEGGITQAISFTLHEALEWSKEGFRAADWDAYPILRFDAVPHVQTDLIGDPEDPPLGVGECTTGPMAAALGNAVKQALGVRICDMPLTVDRIAAAFV
ncbi:xanthine dehydrogenase family protein molybdopterin-binding subunit [Jannaschia sp. CCS1]|uniref:xanthine dehydrogenase family protein molybdopterin-binding subunit n=1 Tax=Jannaschia sp. (strain CCS1) TaxID=290400 RepID=UPI000053ABF7|nr:molybdopterin cofactor-binding domain-containing protein [Jannaschia sp. CCS1]ABD53792.1 aldehyde oxidase and xanthine dehydrogenase molybdopterin binding protein [Jannaschia sp. CCS1]